MIKTEPHQDAGAPLMHGQVLVAPDNRAALDGLVELAAKVCDVAAAVVVTRDGSSPRALNLCRGGLWLTRGVSQLAATLCRDDAYRPIGPIQERPELTPDKPVQGL